MWVISLKASDKHSIGNYEKHQIFKLFEESYIVDNKGFALVPGRNDPFWSTFENPKELIDIVINQHIKKAVLPDKSIATIFDDKTFICDGVRNIFSRLKKEDYRVEGTPTGGEREETYIPTDREVIKPIIVGVNVENGIVLENIKIGTPDTEDEKKKYLYDQYARGNKPMEIKTVTYLNGQNVKDMAENDFISLIKYEEDNIQELLNLETSSKVIDKMIQRRKDNIKKVVELLETNLKDS